MAKSSKKASARKPTPKKKADKPKTNRKRGGAKPPRTHNENPDFDRRRTILVPACVEIEKLQADRDRAIAKIRAKRKELKGDGFGTKQVDFALMLRKADPAEVTAEWRSLLEIASLLSHELVTQPDLFAGTAPAAAKDSYDLGKMSVLEGKGKPCIPPEHLPDEEQQKWIKGWHDQTAALVRSGIKKPDTKLDSEFDDAAPRAPADEAKQPATADA